MTGAHELGFAQKMRRRFDDPAFVALSGQDRSLAETALALVTIHATDAQRVRLGRRWLSQDGAPALIVPTDDLSEVDFGAWDRREFAKARINDIRSTASVFALTLTIRLLPALAGLSTTAHATPSAVESRPDRFVTRKVVLEPPKRVAR